MSLVLSVDEDQLKVDTWLQVLRLESASQFKADKAKHAATLAKIDSLPTDSGWEAFNVKMMDLVLFQVWVGKLEIYLRLQKDVATAREGGTRRPCRPCRGGGDRVGLRWEEEMVAGSDRPAEVDGDWPKCDQAHDEVQREASGRRQREIRQSHPAATCSCTLVVTPNLV